MTGLCERPGCSQVAEVAFGFQADPYVIWLDRATAGTGSRQRAGALCRRHADAMVVPIGWSLDDRRQPVPRLFPSVEATDSSGPPVRRARRRVAPPEEVIDADSTAVYADPTLFDLEPGEATVAELVAPLADDPTAAVDPDSVTDAGPVAADESDATPWRPVFDAGDDLGGLLAAKSPLLSRAFGGRDAPRDASRDALRDAPRDAPRDDRQER